ncbi:MAG: hypothetical protein NTW72_01550 [Gemmatimonadetes bacterium]|nr:hypothetical protein [Gemmatimonadota bacterium]
MLVRIASGSRRALIVLGALGGMSVLSVTGAKAQAPAVRPAAADVARATGDVDETERALYAAVRRAPREPSARGALGAWLASRGQLRTGAVLLEEARLFGGDASAIAARLVHVYSWLRDWSSLAALTASPLSVGEKSRAAALADRGSEVIGADSVVVPFAPLEVGALGRLPMAIGSDTLWAEVDPQVEGLVLPGLARGAGIVEIVGEDRRGMVLIVKEISLGVLTMRNVPARIDPSLGVGRARMGFDLFAMLAPTVDARAGTVTLRRSGRVDERIGVAEIAFVLGFPGVQLAARRGAPMAPIASPAGRSALRGRPWTVDIRRGVIWVQSAP